MRLGVDGMVIDEVYIIAHGDDETVYINNDPVVNSDLHNTKVHINKVYIQACNVGNVDNYDYMTNNGDNYYSISLPYSILSNNDVDEVYAWDSTIQYYPWKDKNGKAAVQVELDILNIALGNIDKVPYGQLVFSKDENGEYTIKTTDGKTVSKDKSTGAWKKTKG